MCPHAACPVFAHCSVAFGSWGYPPATARGAATGDPQRCLQVLPWEQARQKKGGGVSVVWSHVPVDPWPSDVPEGGGGVKGKASSGGLRTFH